jgi:hypothetical protein
MRNLRHSFNWKFQSPTSAKSGWSKHFFLVDRYSVTFYDASYHALALVNGGIFVTADIKYVTLAEKAGGVVRLRDYR